MTFRYVVLLALTGLAGVACQGDPRGAELFAEHCASCHGLDGRGDARRRGFYPQLDLTVSQLVRRGESGAIYRRIAYGYGAMPGFRHELDVSQMLDLAEYTLDFSPARSPHEPGTLP